MKDVHALLEETLRDERWALPVAADALDAIESGARRVRRRRASAAVAGAVAMVVAASVLVGMRETRPDVASRPTTSTIPLPEGPGARNVLAVTPTSLYVMTHRRVHRIDRATHKVLAISPQLPISEPGDLQAVGDTLWVGAMVKSAARYYALDATTLARRTGSLPWDANHVAGSSALFSFQQDSSSRGWLVRLNPRTGKVARRLPVSATCKPPFGGDVAAVDETAKLAWLICYSARDALSMVILDSETGRERGRLPLGNGVPYTAVGSDGTLWVIFIPLDDEQEAWPRKPARYFRLGANESHQLPASAFQEIERLEPSLGMRLVEAGSRLLLQTEGGTELGCIDRRTGRLLATYPVPMRRAADSGALVGDDREIFTTSGDKIIVRRGPDKCLS